MAQPASGLADEDVESDVRDGSPDVGADGRAVTVSPGTRHH